MKKPSDNIHIAVIGSGGYIGKYLCEFLEKKNLSFSKIGRNSIVFKNTGLSKTWTCIEDLEGYYQSESEKTIFINLAGYFVVDHRKVPENFTKLLNDNFIINCQFAELNRRLGKSHLVNVGTTWEKSYTGKNNPRNVYALLKSYAAHFTDYMASNYGSSSINIKLNDTYGRDDKRNKLLPYLKESIISGSKIKINSLNQKLNLTYIDDVVDAIYYAAAQRLTGEGYIISEEVIEIGELLILIEQIVGRKVSFENLGKPFYNTNWSIFKKIPNWKCRYSIEDGMKEYFYGV